MEHDILSSERKKPSLRYVFAGGFMLLGFGFVVSGEHTWMARVLLVLLPALAGLALWWGPGSGPVWWGQVVGAASLLCTSVVIALAPQSLVTSGCDPTAGRVGACLVLQSGHDNRWSRHVDSSPGAVVLAKMKVRASEVTANDVVVRLASSDSFEWVESSLRFANSNTGGHWLTSKYSLLSPGVGFGSYLPGGNVYLNFAVRIADESHFACGVSTVVLPTRVTSSSGSVDVDASIAVTRYC